MRGHVVRRANNARTISLRRRAPARVESDDIENQLASVVPLTQIVV